MPKENIHYSCIACITIDSVINFNKKNHPQVYLEECKYRIKKTQIPKFIKKRVRFRLRVRCINGKIKRLWLWFRFRFRSWVKIYAKKTSFWINLNKYVIDYYWWLIIIVDDYLLLLMNSYCNKTNFSSSINAVISPVLNFFFFFW